MLQPGVLQALSGPPLEPYETLTEFFVYTKHGSFPMALRPSLASDAVTAVEKAVLSGEYAGQDLVRESENLLVVRPKKAWSKRLGSKNRIASGPGLVFVSPQGTLGFTIGPPVKLPETWICVGQIQVLPALLGEWAKAENVLDTVTSIGDPAN